MNNMLEQNINTLEQCLGQWRVLNKCYQSLLWMTN